MSFHTCIVFDLLVHMNALGIVICPQTPSGSSSTSTLPKKVAEISLREIRVMFVAAVLNLISVGHSELYLAQDELTVQYSTPEDIQTPCVVLACLVGFAPGTGYRVDVASDFP